MNPSDLRKAITNDNLKGTKSEHIVIDDTNEGIRAICPDGKTAKEFISAVREKLINDPDVFCHPSMFKGLKPEW